MNLRAALAALFVLGYLGFEIYAIQKTGYRTEPDYIFSQFVGAKAASERCGEPSDEVSRRFSRNFAAVERGAREDFVEQQANETAASTSDYINELIGEREREVEQMIDSQGCEAADVRRLVVLYERRANLNLR